MSSGMFRLPDEAALNAMLKRSHARAVKPMEVKKPDTPPAKPVAGEQANEAGRPPHLDDKPAPKPDNKAFLKKTREAREKIDYAGILVRQITREGLPAGKREHVFAKDIGRAWRIDIAYPDQMLAIEVDGMAHRTKDRFMRDMEKHNELMFHGWRVLRIYTRWIGNEQREIRTGIELVKRAIGATK